MSDSSAHPTNLRPHRLAVELAALLRSGDSILDFAAGRGRNTAYLQAEGFHVDAVSDAEAPEFRAGDRRYNAAISTHGLLHGMPETIQAAVREIGKCLSRSAPFYATFASVKDPRFGAGIRLGDRTFAPADGEEKDVPHTFFDEGGIRDLLGDLFAIESMEEHAAEHVAGSVHWFVRARRV